MKNVKAHAQVGSPVDIIKSKLGLYLIFPSYLWHLALRQESFLGGSHMGSRVARIDKTKAN